MVDHLEEVPAHWRARMLPDGEANKRRREVGLKWFERQRSEGDLDGKHDSFPCKRLAMPIEAAAARKPVP